MKPLTDRLEGLFRAEAVLSGRTLPEHEPAELASGERPACLGCVEPWPCRAYLKAIGVEVR